MKKYRIQKRGDFSLKRYNPDDTGPFSDNDHGQDEARAETDKLLKELDSLQEIFFADARHSLLVVLQAMDTGGKDGLIKKIFAAVNPQGFQISNFKAPTPLELSHDFLWRIHQMAPPKGLFGIFNRSHYEDVLITRVHGWISKEVARERCRHINDFERMLAENGTTIVKLFLYISKDEQKRRLQERCQKPQKRWKFNPDDLKERALWPKYMHAYEAAIGHTSDAYAPWYVIPANKKWYRNYVVAKILVETLKKIDLKWPPLPDGLDCKKIKIT